MFNTFILSNYTASKDIVPALQALPLQGKATDVMPFYNALLAKCQRSKQLEHMQHVLTVMKERHIQLDTASYNILMRAELSTPDATCAFDRFIKQGATPNRATYHILIKHAAQHKQWYALNQWLQLMADNGFEPNPVLVRILFKALVKHPLEKQLVQAFERTIQHVSIDEQLLNTGAAALLETKQTQAAIDILQLAIQKTPSSVYTWNLLLRGLCEQGNVKAALNLFGRIPQPDIVSYTTLIHGLVRTNNNIEDIAHLYRQLVNSSSTNHVLQSNVLLNKHNTTGLFEMNIYNMMIDFYFLHYHKSKRDQVPREALQLLTEAIDTKQLQPTVVTLNIMVRGLAILNKNLNAAERMVNLLKQKGVDMNERTVWYLVKAAHRQGDHDRARQWIETYEQHHIIQGNGLKLLKNKLMSWHSVQK
ncbi:uncharacterized protein B0P05DRAFT_480142 [Gilbertella persicaria]|uniref:uncharacterized protein n=1 Tax=Gilbertella persicaria TaxID=101096 RepID=UPI00221E8EA1|nr:uncharacterized protein B0P05DRAFT_480142 [Gilbertella persicaria]KAI8051043.1 hypothetical protein B0P05DRAFT_480142 [Gilbertella persicaria]